LVELDDLHRTLEIAVALDMSQETGNGHAGWTKYVVIRRLMREHKVSWKAGAEGIRRIKKMMEKTCAVVGGYRLESLLFTTARN
jgi:hypothetical protein